MLLGSSHVCYAGESALNHRSSDAWNDVGAENIRLGKIAEVLKELFSEFDMSSGSIKKVIKIFT
ncbi:hypothetical protein KEJ47_07005 [Candidatus Bathyarchaeota archaeon]|nr:hypothetical protein [Candidatus Bathyarchaeota archaeon]